MKLKLVVALVVLGAVGCAHSSGAESKEKSADTSEDVAQIQKRAVADLNCNEPIKVSVVEEGGMWKPWTFSAAGCGRTATYLSRMGTIVRN